MTPRQMDMGVNAVTALVVASVGVALAGLTWRLAGEPGGKPRAVAAAASVVAAAPVDLTPIVALAPFGAAAPTIAAGGAGGSTSGLILRGVMRATPAAGSTALISSAGGPAEAYAVGQTLPGGAVIDAIEVDHILLRAGGGQEILTFPQKPAAGDTSGVDAIRAAIPASVSGLAPSATPSPSMPIGAPSAGGSAAQTGAVIADFRDRIAAGPQTLIGSLGATATAQGYRIGPTPSAQMRAAGLAPGDVVEKVNGVQVGDAERDRRLFDEAVASGRARVEVVRDGRRIIMSFPLR